MRWNRGHDSPDLIDRRGQGSGAGGPGVGGLMMFLPLLMRTRFGFLALLAIGAFWVYGQLGGGAGAGGGARVPSGEGRGAALQQAAPRADDDLKSFVGFVLDDAQDTWTRELPAQAQQPYRRSKLVLFTDATQTGCGFGEAATGPFYCPLDEHVYIDLGFYKELSGRLGARGEFAQAYVIAHEIGHHVQRILGTNEKVRNARGGGKGAEGASVRLELQADCFAGIWAHSTSERNLLENGDLDSALSAAQAIGDDRLQKRATGTVRPESWTHGSSAQRATWFKRGYETGKVAECDTFRSDSL